MTRWPFIGTAASVLLALGGCGGADETIFCTTEARASVTVQRDVCHVTTREVVMTLVRGT